MEILVSLKTRKVPRSTERDLNDNLSNLPFICNTTLKRLVHFYSPFVDFKNGILAGAAFWNKEHFLSSVCPFSLPAKIPNFKPTPE